MTNNCHKRENLEVFHILTTSALGLLRLKEGVENFVGIAFAESFSPKYLHDITANLWVWLSQSSKHLTLDSLLESKVNIGVLGKQANLV